MMIMRRTVNKYIGVLLSVVLTFLIVNPLFTAEAANTIKLKTPDDYIELTKNCKTDTWSLGKTIMLENDIDLSDIDFVPIPIFQGVFMGNGYTISGVNINSKGSYQGLFRYIQDSGRVENLTVKGTIAPSGTKKYVGGIAGELSGVITNCTFDGNVSGDASVGGICGYVTESGQIKSSYVYGNITGKSYTGGICGQNYGIVELCENHADINATDTEEEKTIQDIGNIDLSEIGKTESINTNTDTGGICGYLKGKITLCKNYGNIGYRSIGYNTGGICGRSTGYIVSCENNGEINGRKDIGGICGQAEPYVMLEYSESVLDDIRGELNNIKDTINIDINSDDNSLYNSINDINSVLGDITDRVSLLSDDVTDYANDITAQTNDMLDRIHYALDESNPVFTNMSASLAQMAEGLEDFRQAGTEINTAVNDLYDQLNDSLENGDNQNNGSISKTMEYLEAASKHLSRALSELEDCIDSLYQGIDKLSYAIDTLKDALTVRQNIEDAFLSVAESLDGIISAFISAENSISAITQVLEELKNQGLITNLTKDTIDSLKALPDKCNAIKKALGDIRDALTILGDSYNIRSLANSVHYFSKAFSKLEMAFSEMKKLTESIDISLEPDEANDAMTRAFDSLNNGCTVIKDSTGSLAAVSNELNRIVNDISQDGAITLPSVSDSFSENIDGLKNSVNDMQREFSSLNDIFKNEKSKLGDNINDITDQLSLLSDILSDAYDDSLDYGKDDYYEDISDYDRSGDTRGKIENSNNMANVFGDVNVGGIVGSMAIEYDFDPEDDVLKSGEKSPKFTYKTKCIIRHCSNVSEVTSKKNYSGGIVGRMDLGSILSCDNYGKISSTDGNYTGGIAGKSDTVIRNSAAKCTLLGNDYTGGITGKGSKIINCQTLIHIDQCGEFTGAIAGDADTDMLARNYCVNDTLGAVDDINYTGIAEQSDVDRFVTFVDNNFNKDVAFTLKFVADDDEVAELTYNYKDSIPDEDVPPVPEKKGYYGKWSDYNFKEVTYDAVITAEYNRNMDIIASDAKRENGKSVILLCGAFDDRASVSAVQLKNCEAIDSYDVSINGVYTDNYTVRYLPKSDKKVNICIDSGDGLKKVSAKSYGRYLEFKTDSPTFRLCEVKKSNTMLYICIAITILLIFAGIIVFLKKKISKNLKITIADE